MKLLLSLMLLAGGFVDPCFGQDDTGTNCLTILIGMNASVDGSVFVAHNEDDLNDHNSVDLHKVPRIRHDAAEKQVFLNRTDSTDSVRSWHRTS